MNCIKVTKQIISPIHDVAGSVEKSQYADLLVTRLWICCGNVSSESFFEILPKSMDFPMSKPDCRQTWGSWLGNESFNNPPASKLKYCNSGGQAIFIIALFVGLFVHKNILMTICISRLLLILFLLPCQLVRELLQEGEEEEADEVPGDDDGDVHGQGEPGIHGCHLGVGEEDESDAVEHKSAPEEVGEDAKHASSGVDRFLATLETSGLVKLTSSGQPLVDTGHPKDGSNAGESVDPDEPSSSPLDVGHQLSKSQLLHAEDEGEGEPLLSRVNQLQK